MSTFADALNEQISYEFAASQQYIAVAVYYDSETLPQLAAHFYRQAVEERNHAMIIVQYLLDANEKVVIPAVQAPHTDFADPVAPVALALEQEKRVTEQISALVALPKLSTKLQCFSDTWASPMVRPRQPAASISAQALCPGGFLKVEPPVFSRIGCDASRAAVIRSISARIAAGSPARP